MHVPPEFRLVAACCRWPPSDARVAAVRDAAAPPLDWRRLRDVVARHRVEGLVQDGLSRAGVTPPEEVASALKAAAKEIAAENLRFVAETGRLARKLQAAGVDFIFVKGLTLNVLAYETLGVKKSADIDIAVDPAAYPAAVDVMAEAGYACVNPYPGAPRTQILGWADHAKHTIWDRGRTAVELHKSFVDSPLMLPAVSVASPRQTVAIAPGLTVETLAKEELFAYLCVHGATHAWSRLKWLADVAALLKDADGAEIERLHRRSVELGGGRAAAQALLLCADLFAMPLPAALERRLRSDAATRYLARVALKSMLRGGGVTELEDMALGTAAIHLSHFRLMRGWRYKAAELKRKLATGSSHGEQSLGMRLVQPVAAPLRWLARRTRRSRDAARKAG